MTNTCLGIKTANVDTEMLYLSLIAKIYFNFKYVILLAMVICCLFEEGTSIMKKNMKVANCGLMV